MDGLEARIILTCLELQNKASSVLQSGQTHTYMHTHMHACMYVFVHFATLMMPYFAVLNKLK